VFHFPTRRAVSAVRPQSVGGFTLLEMTMALLIASITLAGFSVAYMSYRSSVSARRAAQVFAQDLSVARSYSVRSRDTVKVVFIESTPRYVISSSAGDTLVDRSFDPTAEIVLDTMDLDVSGDSIFFDSRGRIDFSGISGSLGVARFILSNGRFRVRFNLLGTSRVSPL